MKVQSGVVGPGASPGLYLVRQEARPRGRPARAPAYLLTPILTPPADRLSYRPDSASADAPDRRPGRPLCFHIRYPAPPTPHPGALRCAPGFRRARESRCRWTSPSGSPCGAAVVLPVKYLFFPFADPALRLPWRCPRLVPACACFLPPEPRRCRVAAAQLPAPLSQGL